MKKAAAPATIDRASVATYDVPSVLTVRTKVARATEGAAPKIPAKLLGLNRSPRTAKVETTAPPIKKRKNNSSNSVLRHPFRSINYSNAENWWIFFRGWGAALL